MMSETEVEKEEEGRKEGRQESETASSRDVSEGASRLCDSLLGRLHCQEIAIYHKARGRNGKSKRSEEESRKETKERAGEGKKTKDEPTRPLDSPALQVALESTAHVRHNLRFLYHPGYVKDVVDLPLKIP